MRAGGYGRIGLRGELPAGCDGEADGDADGNRVRRLVIELRYCAEYAQYDVKLHIDADDE